MGRYAKNRELRSASYSIRFPVGTNSLGPNDPVDGLVRFNRQRQRAEIYYKNKWRPLGTGGDIEFPTKETFYGNGTDVVFGPMRFSYPTGNELYVMVYVQNVWQNPGVNYILDEYEIIFASPPPDGHNIVVLHGIVINGDYSELIPNTWVNTGPPYYEPYYDITISGTGAIGLGSTFYIAVNSVTGTETLYYTIEEYTS